MNELQKGLYRAVRIYLKLLPLVIIPVAGILLLVTAAPYYAVSKGCKELEGTNILKRRKLALSFAILLSTFFSGILLLISYLFSSIFAIGSNEIWIIALIYASFIFFSILGSREN